MKRTWRGEESKCEPYKKRAQEQQQEKHDAHTHGGAHEHTNLTPPRVTLRLHHVLQAHAEFQSPDVSHVFFRACDADTDGEVGFNEYLACRGEHDMFGNPNDVSEWPLRADVVLADYEDAVARAAEAQEGQGDGERRTWQGPDGIIVD